MNVTAVRVGSILRSKPYLLACCGMAIFTYQGGRDIISILLAAIQIDFNLNYTALGIIAASYDWGHVAILLMGGYLSDRYGKGRAIFVGLAWFIVANAATGLSSSPWPLIGLRFAAGFAFGTYFVAGNSLLAEAFAPSERGRAIGLHYAGGSGGRLVIPLLAGAITANSSWHLAFLPLSAAAAAAALLLLFLRLPISSPLPVPGSNWKAPWSKVLKNRALFKVSAISFLIMFANSEMVFIPAYLVRTWSLSIFQAALYLGITALVAVPGAPFLGELSDRLGWKKVLVGTLIADALLLALFPAAAPGIGLILVLLGLGIVNCSPYVVVALATRASEPSNRGISLGLFQTTALVSLTISSVLGGYIADLAGLSTTFLFISLVAFASTAILVMTKLGDLELKW